MKKIMMFIITICLVFCALFTPAVVNLKVDAMVDDDKSKIVSYMEDFMCINNEFMRKQIQDRRPGSQGEKQAAINIYNKILYSSQFLNLELVNDGSTTDGVQYFQFNNVYTGLSSISQNLRFVKRGTIDDGKKIIIGTSYDNSPYYDYETETFYDVASSAGNVATLLYVAEMVNTLTDNVFDIEIVFFGAGKSDHAGAYGYINSMTQKEIENTLLFVNLDQITIGQNLYLYVNEFKTHQEDYINKVFKNANVKVNEYNATNTLNYGSSGKFTYSHRALEGNNIAFMEKSIVSLNIFSGCYESLGQKDEYNGKNNIIGTKNDTYENLKENFGFENLYQVADGLIELISDDTLKYNMTKDRPTSSWFEFWTNEKYPIMFMIIIAFIFSMVYISIYYKNKNRAAMIIKQKGVSGLMKEITDIEKEIEKEEIKKENGNKKNKQ